MARINGHSIAKIAGLALMVAGAGLFSATAFADTGIGVTMNEAKIVKLARPADTIIIGNPAIADASVQDAKTIVLTGKGFGITNLVVLDTSGSPIIDEQVTVSRGAYQFGAHLPAIGRPDIVVHALLRKRLQERRREGLGTGNERFAIVRRIGPCATARLARG